MEVNQRWSMDFVSDQLRNGRRFRVLKVVDDYSREMAGQLVSIPISSRQAAAPSTSYTRLAGNPRRSSLTMELSLPAKSCSSGTRSLVYLLALSNPASLLRTLLLKA